MYLVYNSIFWTTLLKFIERIMFKIIWANLGKYFEPFLIRINSKGETDNKDKEK